MPLNTGRHDSTPNPESREIITISEPEPIEATEKPKAVSAPFELEDFKSPKSTDFDFPRQANLPALKLDEPLPINVLSDRTQSRVLGWEAKTVRVVNHQTGIFTDLPMICAGTAGCPFGSICPVSNRDDFIGLSCPLEVREIFKNFSGYVRDLKVESTDFIDLKMIAALCRHHLTMWRADMAMKTEPQVDEEVSVVAQKTGETYKRKVINKNIEIQTITEEKISKIYKELIATRDARQKNSKEGDIDTNMSVLMSKLSGISTKAEKSNGRI